MRARIPVTEETDDILRSPAYRRSMGWLGGTYGVTDDNRFIGVVRFESKEAGFVQVIQGRVSDLTPFRTFMLQPMDELRSVRPEIIGGSFALSPDGYFTETVASRSEAEARAGESNEMPEDVGKSWEDAMALMQDVTYLDLRHPWFASKD